MTAEAVKIITSGRPDLNVDVLGQEINFLLSHRGFPYASRGENFSHAEFSGDAMTIARDLLPYRPEVAEAVITRLAELQARDGRIPHEYRCRDGAPPKAQDRLTELILEWGHAQSPEEAAEIKEVAAWTNVYSTPFFVSFVADYCRVYGKEILGKPRIRDSVLLALSWLEANITPTEEGGLDLLESVCKDPRGNLFYGWKDGATSVIFKKDRETQGHAKLANYRMPIALLDVQGIAADALLGGAELFEEELPQKALEWGDKFQRLQAATFNHFRMKDGYFAMAIDRDPVTGEPRQVDSRTTTPGAFLNSRIWEGLSEEEYEKYISDIVRTLFSWEFLTPIGFRCRSAAEIDSLDYDAYQSSKTVWLKDCNDSLLGLHRHRLVRLADFLECCMLRSNPTAEFTYVLSDGTPILDPYNSNNLPVDVVITGTNHPDDGQGWSASAVYSILMRRSGGSYPYTSDPRWNQLEADILDSFIQQHTEIPLIGAFVDIEEGRRREAAYLRQYGYH